jgi:hypothetical protein
MFTKQCRLLHRLESTLAVWLPQPAGFLQQRGCWDGGYGVHLLVLGSAKEHLLANGGL